MNMKQFTILVLIGIAVVTLIVFLYSFTYNLAFGQLDNNDHSIPQQYDFGNGSIWLLPLILMETTWRSGEVIWYTEIVTVRKGDIKSFDGVGMNFIVMECAYGVLCDDTLHR